MKWFVSYLLASIAGGIAFYLQVLIDNALFAPYVVPFSVWESIAWLDVAAVIVLVGPFVRLALYAVDYAKAHPVM